MKKVTYILFIGLGVGLAACNSNNTKETKITADSVESEITADDPTATNPEPIMSFEETVWDFGTITDGERVSHTFKFKNTGKADLIISNATASCGCTIPVWPKEPIKPGQEGEIKVEFNSKGKIGNVTKDINVIANTNPVQTILKIKVQVNPA
jgi:hypothetical protein